VKQSNKITAIYCRTAHHDPYGISIENQKQVLHEYATEQGYTNLAIYVDEGFSGLTFDRPSFAKLEAEIKAGRVSAVIVKDISRIGRNSIEAMKWIWKITDAGVSFISINQPDGILPTETYLDALLAASLNGGERE